MNFVLSWQKALRDLSTSFSLCPTYRVKSGHLKTFFFCLKFLFFFFYPPLYQGTAISQQFLLSRIFLYFYSLLPLINDFDFLLIHEESAHIRHLWPQRQLLPLLYLLLMHRATHITFYYRVMYISVFFCWTINFLSTGLFIIYFCIYFWSIVVLCK